MDTVWCGFEVDVDTVVADFWGARRAWI